MTKWILSGLIVLNLLLGAALFVRFSERKAEAQGIGGGRQDYAAIAGYNNNQTILYILDSNSGNLIAVRSDPANKTFQPLGQGNILGDLRRIR